MTLFRHILWRVVLSGSGSFCDQGDPGTCRVCVVKFPPNGILPLLDTGCMVSFAPARYGSYVHEMLAECHERKPELTVSVDTSWQLVL